MQWDDTRDLGVARRANLLWWAHCWPGPAAGSMTTSCESSMPTTCRQLPLTSRQAAGVGAEAITITMVRSRCLSTDFASDLFLNPVNRMGSKRSLKHERLRRAADSLSSADGRLPAGVGSLPKPRCQRLSAPTASNVQRIPPGPAQSGDRDSKCTQFVWRSRERGLKKEQRRCGLSRTALKRCGKMIRVNCALAGTKISQTSEETRKSPTQPSLQ